MQYVSDATYTSIAEFVAAANLPARCKENEQRRLATLNDANEGHSGLGAGCRTGKDVQRLMRDGWPDGMAKVTAMREKIPAIELTPVDRRRRQVRGPSGDHLDIHSVYAGRLDIAWTEAKRRYVAAPQHVQIIVNTNMRWSDDADLLLWRGVAALVLCDLLEAANFRVQIAMGQAGEMDTSDKEKINTRIIVKDHANPLDINSMTCALLPGFTRAIQYAWKLGHAQRRVGGSLSRVYGVKIEKRETSDVIIPESVCDRDSALRFVNSAIAAINSNQLAA